MNERFKVFEDERESKEDLLKHWRLIVKKKWVVVFFLGAAVLFTGIFSFLATPKYKATCTLLIEDEESRILSLEDQFGYRYQRADILFFNTQLELLKSKSLAQRVAQRMNLLNQPEFNQEKSGLSLMSLARSFISLNWISSGKKEENQESNPVLANPYSGIAQRILGGMEISPIRETKLVKVSYTSGSPVLAADVVNALTEEFINFSVEKRYRTTHQASDFLTEQIANLREDLAAKEKQLQKYGQEKELFFLSDEESVAVNKFGDLNKAYTQAQIQRIKAEAEYKEFRGLEVGSLPQYVNNSVIQNLKAEYSRIKNEHIEKSKIFKPSYPEMERLQAKLDSMSEQLETEIKKAVDSAKSEYQSALEKERSLRSLLEEEKKNVSKMNSNAIFYSSLKIEVENKRKLLDSLIERQNETLVSSRLAGLKTSSVSIVDKAEVPKSPVSPKKKRNLILAILVGLFGGAGLCFVLDYLDNTVKEPEDSERLAGLPSLGIIPYLPPEGMRKKKKYYSRYHYSYSYGDESKGEEEDLPEIKEIELINHYHPQFFIAEDYRTIRTSILLSSAEGPPQSIVFTSASPREGKTTTLANMAVSFAQLEKRVLVIDSDLRKPRLHRVFGVKNFGGLSGYLTGKVSIEEAVKKTKLENVWILPSGAIPPNPAELLNSQKMRVLIEELKKGFDFILLDSPPVLAVVDPVILSSMVERTILVVEAGKTVEKPFMQSVEELRKANGKIMGVIFNEAKMERGGYYDTYYRYKYMDYYRKEKES